MEKAPDPDGGPGMGRAPLRTWYIVEPTEMTGPSMGLGGKHGQERGASKDRKEEQEPLYSKNCDSLNMAQRLHL